MIKLTGIADEAGASLDVQIQAHQELGWDSIESRIVEFDGVKGNLHEIPEATFDKVVARLAEKNMQVSGFGSLIGNWAKKITDDFSITEAEIARAIPRMQRLGAKLIRVMSYAVCKDDSGKDLEEQFAPERIRRMTEINKRFADAGITVVSDQVLDRADASLMQPEVAGPRLLMRTLWPPLVSVIGFVPLLIGRSAALSGRDPVGAMASASLPVVILFGLIVVWVRFRDDIHASMAEATGRSAT